jgi:glutaredoxin-like YruB-family protein
LADKKVVIYSMPTCPNCKRAKDYFSRNGIAYTNIDVAHDKSAAKEMIQKSGQLGVPVILIDDQVIVGFNQSKLDAVLAK